ncbi:MAG TPA: NAD(P)-dependent oxidoreductase [Candidatus Binataceae bacterium]|nr:NAD(P)-dependent oxidoreductase [Candidatus Binataceae bacterium]
MGIEVGFVGLGSMGVPMAEALIDAGMSLTVFNRTASKAEPLVAKGARLVTSAGDVAKPGGIVVTMVADDAALESIALGEDGVAARLGKGGVHLSMSTVSPALSRRLAEHHARHGCIYLAAPVFGRPERARARKLWIVISGAAAAKERIRPLLDAMGQQTFDMGDEPAAANVMKLVNNFLIMSAIEALSEALVMAEKGGLEGPVVAKVLTGSLFNCPLYQGYLDTITKRAFEPAGFKLKLGLKDIELAMQMAHDTDTPVPTASLVRDRILVGLAHGRGEMDWAAIAIGTREDAGLKP